MLPLTQSPLINIFPDVDLNDENLTDTVLYEQCTLDVVLIDSMFTEADLTNSYSDPEQLTGMKCEDFLKARCVIF